DFHCLAQCLDEILRFRDRPGAPATIGSRHGAEIDVRVFDADTDGLIFHGAVAYDSDSFLVLFVVEIGAVTANDDEQWNLVVHRRPKSADGEQQAAVGLDIYAEFAGALERKGSTERSRQAVPQTSTFIFS